MATSDSPLNVPNVTLAVARGAGGAPGFSAQSGFALSDNGDGTMTITDNQSRFGLKPGGSGPVLAYKFGETGNYTRHSASRYTGNVTFNSTGSSKISNTEGFNGAAFAAEYLVSGQAFIQHKDPILDVSRTIPEPYMFIRRRFNWTAAEAYAEDPSTWNWKHTRFLAEDALGSNPALSMLDGQFQLSGIRYQFNAGARTNISVYDNTININDKFWHTEEYLITENLIEAWQDGNKFTESSTLDWSGGFSHVELWRPQTINVPGATNYADIIFFDDSPCQVFIANQSSWDDTQPVGREVQIPLLWSTGSIEFEKYLGGLSLASGTALYVRRADKTVIKAGVWI